MRRLTDADRLAWATYEDKAERAANEYATRPICGVNTGTRYQCIRECGARTYHTDRVCAACRVKP